MEPDKGTKQSVRVVVRALARAEPVERRGNTFRSARRRARNYSRELRGWEAATGSLEGVAIGSAENADKGDRDHSRNDRVADHRRAGTVQTRGPEHAEVSRHVAGARSDAVADVLHGTSSRPRVGDERDPDGG